MTTNQDLNLKDLEQLSKSISQLPDTELKATLVEAETSPRDRIPTEKASAIIEGLAQKYNTTKQNALIGLTYLVQEGGTNSGKKNLKRTVNGIVFDIEDIRNIIRVHAPSGTVRQVAKTYRDVIAMIALKNAWPGPLLKELQRQNPTTQIATSDSIYCCEIHTDNYANSMPAVIREALKVREAKLRENSVKTKPQQKKPPKKGGKKK